MISFVFSLVGGEGGHQMQGALAVLSIMAAARGLAVDGNTVWIVRPAFGDPRRRPGFEHVRIDPIHHGAHLVGARNAVVGRRKKGSGPVN
jgi:hypothetical protein